MPATLAVPFRSPVSPALRGMAALAAARPFAPSCAVPDAPTRTPRARDAFAVAADNDPDTIRAIGHAALAALSERFGLHLMRNPALPGSTVTLVTTADVLPSAPSGPHSRALRERVGVVAAQGALDFTAAERARVEAAPEAEASTAIRGLAEAVQARRAGAIRKALTVL